MSSLRSKMIRLAYARPDLRPHLLPILVRTKPTKEAKAVVNWGDVAISQRRLLKQQEMTVRASILALWSVARILKNAPSASGDELLSTLELIDHAKALVDGVKEDVKDTLGIRRGIRRR